MNRSSLLLLSLVSTPAWAQDTGTTADPTTFDAHGFTLSAFDGDVRDPLVVQRPGSFEQWDWWASGALEFAKAPLVLVTLPAEGTEGESTRQSYLDNLFALNASVGVAVHERVRFDATLPLVFTSSGSDGAQGLGMGDPRLTAMLSLVRPEDDLGFGLGAAPFLDIPIGADLQFLGDGGVGGGATVAGSYAFAKATLGADIGVNFRPTITLDNLTGSDSLVYGLFVNYLPREDVGLTAETRFSSPFTKAGEPGTEFPAELLLSARKRYESGAHAMGGFSVGLTRGASAAAWRIFLGGGFGKMGDSTKDTDMDGCPDKVDTCPTEPESVNGWKDDDCCPDQLGSIQVTVKLDDKDIVGAPTKVVGPDGTETAGTSMSPGQTLANAMPGSTWTASATYGECYAGKDSATAAEGLTIPVTIDLEPVLNSTVKFEVVDTLNNKIPGATATWDKADGPCTPAQPVALTDGTGSSKVGAGTHKAFVTAPDFEVVARSVTIEPGAEQTIRVVLEPTRIKMTDTQIVILQKVYFDYDKDTIKSESFKLLDEVAVTLMAHPELGRIEVAGHTDSKGNDAYNADLSQRRVDSVVKYLADRGVDTTRLVAKGYGETKPVDTNKTDKGRENNRRVEFNILGK